MPNSDIGANETWPDAQNIDIIFHICGYKIPFCITNCQITVENFLYKFINIIYERHHISIISKPFNLRLTWQGKYIEQSKPLFHYYIQKYNLSDIMHISASLPQTEKGQLDNLGEAAKLMSEGVITEI